MTLRSSLTWRTCFSSTGLVVALIGLLAIIIVAPDFVSPYDTTALDLKARLAPPSLAHLFGTDEGGRDLFSRIVHGARYSVGTSMIIVLAAAIIGLVIGAISGMASRLVDNILMRIVDVFMGFPALVLSLAVAAAVGRGLTGVIISLLLIWWPGYARYVRSEVRRLRELPHIEAATALGASNFLLLRRHILPFVIQGINVRITTDIGYALVAVTALSFLGLGVRSPIPEWGLLIRDSRSYFGVAWWYMMFPGLMVMITATAFSLLGDRLAAQNSGGSR
ncbi:MAG: hypothetical protein RLZZ444_514 [Pseudomonadota bacterium]